MAGPLTGIEYHPTRARGAAGNIRRTGLADAVTIVPGDAFQGIPKLARSADFVFLNSWTRDVLDAIHNNPDPVTSMVEAGEESMSLTVILQ